MLTTVKFSHLFCSLHILYFLVGNVMTGYYTDCSVSVMGKSSAGTRILGEDFLIDVFVHSPKFPPPRVMDRLLTAEVLSTPLHCFDNYDSCIGTPDHQPCEEQCNSIGYRFRWKNDGCEPASECSASGDVTSTEPGYRCVCQYTFFS